LAIKARRREVKKRYNRRTVSKRRQGISKKNLELRGAHITGPGKDKGEMGRKAEGFRGNRREKKYRQGKSSDERHPKGEGRARRTA